eukprot:2808093-Pyramimonas_sp.AAC.1
MSCEVPRLLDPAFGGTMCMSVSCRRLGSAARLAKQMSRTSGAQSRSGKRAVPAVVITMARQPACARASRAWPQ